MLLRAGIISLFLLGGLVVAQASPPSAQDDPSVQTAPAQEVPLEQPPNESDPTKSVFLSLRSEYYNLRGDAWQHGFVVRMDHAFLKDSGLLGGKAGLLTRLDLSEITNHSKGATHSGLGDLYVQALWIPWLTRRFALGMGSGLVLPTATYTTLGTGKWQAAPVVVPVWFLPKRRGFFLVKLQNSVSFAGDRNRTDINILSTQPILVYQFKKRWWTLLDSEIRTDWINNNHRSYRSGIELGRIFKSRFAISAKPEFPWGRYRQGDWTLKFTFTRYKLGG